MRPWTALLLGLLIAACERPGAPPDTRRAVGVGERMAAPPDPGFSRADRPRVFEFPADHGAHPDFATEWWYFTGNLATPGGQRLGYQFTLFRVGLKPGRPASDSPWRSNQFYMGHLAITDVAGGRHLSSERFGRAAVGLAGARAAPLRVWLGSWSIEGNAQAGPFPLQLRADSDDIAIELALEAGTRPRILQGDRGWSRKSAAPGNASYYYSHTRLPTAGRLRIGATWYQVEGNSWFDREWSSSALADDQAGWDWFSLQLADGRDLMFYRMRDQQGRAQAFSRGVLVDAGGDPEPLTLRNTSLEAHGYWTSPDGIRYPTKWHLQVPGHAIDLDIEAAVQDQEMDHSVRYWEGAVDVSGSHTGVGYLELSGYAR